MSPSKSGKGSSDKKGKGKGERKDRQNASLRHVDSVVGLDTDSPIVGSLTRLRTSRRPNPLPAHMDNQRNSLSVNEYEIEPELCSLSMGTVQSSSKRVTMGGQWCGGIYVASKTCSQKLLLLSPKNHAGV